MLIQFIVIVCPTEQKLDAWLSIIMRSATNNIQFTSVQGQQDFFKIFYWNKQVFSSLHSDLSFNYQNLFRIRVFYFDNIKLIFVT